jgi:hypothetical protein
MTPLAGRDARQSSACARGGMAGQPAVDGGGPSEWRGVAKL